ncbi:hypothetical protein AC09_0777 [Escherichia coli 6-175-07_S3_C1]|nr:hypothetical protein AC37_0894 [Escherichia coli 6-175-07_S3_C2]KEL97484.1 hypothetical protein AC09_0777 [Escherichia coli 6-175-07_S3_C1]KEM05602.1 hypothetical protein AC62_0756 [Escherichia coli 6-175-07_S3_C3]KEM23575.1 hypothetical protein AC10_0790 [Escherichia coli 6-319-05_S3_C1]KEM33216.1 hypothetical protein AC38_0899 [Escherichia coli 6-319-05_S3_C2]
MEVSLCGLNLVNGTKKLSWVTNMWGVEYEEIPEMHDE